MTDSEKLIKLKQLLLNEDREFAQNILQKLEDLEETVRVYEKLSEKVNPIIDKKFDAFIEEIPSKLGPTIANALTKSQDSVVEALFPMIGKMVKKYIQQEIKTLSDNINNQVQYTFSIKTWQRKIKAIFTGVSEKEIILSEMNRAVIEQIFVIENGSGIIISSASKKESIDQDMIAGMLTAIKSFFEDAFMKDQQGLELIQYELFEIYIKNFTTYYFAVVISGGCDVIFKNKLEDKLFDIAAKIKTDAIDKEQITTKLNEFINE